MSWWQQNRRALIALPFVLALVVLSGSSRLVNFWWPTQLNEPVAAVVGEPLDVTVRTLDEAGAPTDIDLGLEVGQTTEITQFVDAEGNEEPVPTIEGTRVWRTDVTFSASPEDNPTVCFAEVVDSQERTTRYATTAVGLFGLPFSPCQRPFSALEEESSAQSWTVPVLVRLTEDVEPTELRLWWTTPDYVAVPLEISGD